MARNTSTFGQLPDGAPLLGTDLLVIQRTDGLNFSITGSDLATLVGGLITLNGDATAAQIIAGTANRISLVDTGATHTFDIDAAYVGQASIITLGTITTGVWNGSVIDATFLDANIVYNDQANTYTGGGDQDFGTAALRNVGFLEADGAAASAGLVRGRNANDALAWRNAAGTNNIDIIVNAADSFLYRFNGATQYIISATQFDFNGNNLVDAVLVTPTIASFVNATHDHQSAAGGGTLLSTSALSDTADIAYLNQANAFGAFETSFLSGRFQWRDSDNTNNIQVVTNLESADRTITIPVLGGNQDLVLRTLAQTLTNKTLTTPTIASFTNATHDHSNAAGGGNLTNSALTSGVFTAITGLGIQSQTLDMAANDIIIDTGSEFFFDGGSTVGLALVSNQLRLQFLDDTAFAGFKIQNSDGSLEIINASATVGRFFPNFVYRPNVESSTPAFRTQVDVIPADDTGSNPVIDFFARRVDGTDITTRPIARFSNRATNLWEISAAGNVNMQGNNLILGDIEINGALNHDGSTVGFYGTPPIVQQTGVAVTDVAIHAALVNLGLITA